MGDEWSNILPISLQARKNLPPKKLKKKNGLTPQWPEETHPLMTIGLSKQMHHDPSTGVTQIRT